ncbi:hypothetical protein F4212_01425 [Candidatus Poribacteria bacterium]|nr:hypothetical protein [Candidatus Poribacteria bacterium]
MAFEENLDVFFNTKDFAIEVEISPERTSPQNQRTKITGIFEDPYAAAQLGSYLIVATNPVFMTKWSPPVEALRHNHFLFITDEDGNQKTYRVEGQPKHDGTGIARILLVDELTQDEPSEDAVTLPQQKDYY